MIFDRLASFVERSRSATMQKVVGDSRLFHFPINAHEVLQKELSPDTIRYLQEQFFLPFPVVAVEDNASCVIIQDLAKEPVGLLHHNRCFIDCLSMDDANLQGFRDYAKHKYNLSGLSVVNMGVMRVDEVSPTGYLLSTCSDVASFLFSGNDLLTWMVLPNDDLEVLRPVSQNWMTAIEELMLLNSTDKFILEKSPTVVKHHSPKRIARSHQRPIYTILHPNKIREEMRLPLDGETKGLRHSPVPHDRRAHTRTLLSERFTKARGKTIFIPATWIGPSENVVRRHRYRVLLDR